MFHFKSIPAPSQVPQEEWTHWKWQMQNALKTPEQFEKSLNLSEEEKKAIHTLKTVFAVKTTPYYLQLCQKYSSIRQMALPHLKELNPSDFYQEDPLGEKKHNPVPRVIHRYPRSSLVFSNRFLRNLLSLLHQKTLHSSRKPQSLF